MEESIAASVMGFKSEGLFMGCVNGRLSAFKMISDDFFREHDSKFKLLDGFRDCSSVSS